MGDYIIVKYGNEISIKHNATGRLLTSVGGYNYQSGSSQQIIYAGDWNTSYETTFVFLPGLNSESEEGCDVNIGEVVRLKHVATRANLHSHGGIDSPISGQQEVTCFGDDDNTDENDEWIVEQWGFDESENETFDLGDPTLYIGRSFILRHAATGQTLHSHDILISDNQNEVTCYGDGPDENDRWRISEN